MRTLTTCWRAFVSDESMWRAVHRMEAAAEQVRREADRIEESVRRFAVLLEDGYGANGLRLIELLEKHDDSPQ